MRQSARALFPYLASALREKTGRAVRAACARSGKPPRLPVRLLWRRFGLRTVQPRSRSGSALRKSQRRSLAGRALVRAPAALTNAGFPLFVLPAVSELFQTAPARGPRADPRSTDPRDSLRE